METSENEIEKMWNYAVKLIILHSDCSQYYAMAVFNSPNLLW